MNGTNETYYEEIALSYLPVSIAEQIRKSTSFSQGICEIRLTVGAPVCITTAKEAEMLSAVFTHDDMRNTVRCLCGNSVYSHSETVKEGYITTSDGIRAGIAGRAVTEKGCLAAVSDITSAVIRIPRRAAGAADELYSLMKRFEYRGSILVYSPPGGGKTTVLRELAVKLGQDPSFKRVAVVDTRCELSFGIEGMNICTLSGYPRFKGIEIAVRTLGAQVIICDEISTRDDVSAALECLGAGVTLVASVHGTREDIESRTVVKELMHHGLFKAYYGIEKQGERFFGRITLAGNQAV